MARITEDYVSFEVAKLLKEKGFNVYGDGSFDSGIEVFAEYSPSSTLNKCIDSKPHQKAYPAPTHQMAMKWLREVYNIFIEIGVSIDLNGDYHFGYTILDKECKYVRRGYTFFDWSYEDAVEAALEYCLEILI